jgi:hypothetical protein
MLHNQGRLYQRNLHTHNMGHHQRRTFVLWAESHVIGFCTGNGISIFGILPRFNHGCSPQRAPGTTGNFLEAVDDTGCPRATGGSTSSTMWATPTTHNPPTSGMANGSTETAGATGIPQESTAGGRPSPKDQNINGPVSCKVCYRRYVDKIDSNTILLLSSIPCHWIGMMGRCQVMSLL